MSLFAQTLTAPLSFHDVFISSAMIPCSRRFTSVRFPRPIDAGYVQVYLTTTSNVSKKIFWVEVIENRYKSLFLDNSVSVFKMFVVSPSESAQRLKQKLNAVKNEKQVRFRVVWFLKISVSPIIPNGVRTDVLWFRFEWKIRGVFSFSFSGESAGKSVTRSRQQLCGV